MPQQIKALVPKPDKLSLLPRTHIEPEALLHSVMIFALLCLWPCTRAQTKAHKHKEITPVKKNILQNSG